MITQGGQRNIKRFFAGQVGQMAGSVALGVGTSAPALTDTKLVHEVARLTIVSISADLENNRLVFKAVCPPGLIGTVYELGLFSLSDAPSLYRRLGAVTSGGGLWTGGTADPTNVRLGSHSLKIDYVASGTSNAELIGINEDFSDYSDIDDVIIAFFAGTNLSSIRINVGTDSANYFQFTITNPIAGFNTVKVKRSTATKTGAPSWSNITYLAVKPSATTAGPGSVWFDAITFEYNNILDEENLLVSRDVPATPLIINPDIPSEIEYSLGLTA